jgi:hypothetical protein
MWDSRNECGIFSNAEGRAERKLFPEILGQFLSFVLFTRSKKTLLVRNFPFVSRKIGSSTLPIEKFSWDFLSLAKAATGQSS